MEVDHKISSDPNRTETERATRDEEAAQTSEGSIGYLGRHILCVPDLQEDLPLANWALKQSQSPLQLDHGMMTKAQTHCLPRQKHANDIYIYTTMHRYCEAVVLGTLLPRKTLFKTEDFQSLLSSCHTPIGT